MTTLQFANTHNLVVFLSKPAESEGFKQIVDFLNANLIKYALTINPTIYTSCIEQFWATIKVKTVNGEVQLQALVDGKKIIITEASVRHDLQLNDEEEQGEGSKMPTDPHHTPTIIQPSTSQPQKKQKPRKPKRKDTKVPQPSGPIDNVADEAVYEEMDDSLERAITTATSLDVEQDRGNINRTQSKETLNELSSLGTSLGSGTRRQETMRDTIAQTGFENVFKTSNDLLLIGVNTPRSDEDSLKLKELMELCTNLQNRVIDLEKTKTSQAQEITSLKRKVKRLERKEGKNSWLKIIQGINLVSTHFDADTDMFGVHDLVGDEVVVETEVASKDVNLSVDEVTLAQALAALKSAKPKADKVMLQEPKSRVKVQDKGKGKMVEPKKPIKKKELIRLDEENSSKLQAEFDEEVRLTREKSKTEEEANIVLCNKEQFKEVGTDYGNKKSIKNQKVDEDIETAELQRLIEVVPDKEEVAIDAIPLATKPPSIVDTKIYKERIKLLPD
ncbi:hypothetical protein Tco_1351192 [Tanacetum coccineum]